MLSEKDIRERAEYCYLVCLQLNWLDGNYNARPEQYLDYLKKSSLGLAEDEYIRTSIEEGLMTGEEDAGLNELILVYESLVMAFCEVLEINSEKLKEGIPLDRLKNLASEMGIILGDRVQG
jgi:hypothetical protein